ncbi:tRNA (adenosine(37)-N6)-dimethylallyltransferase MiaA [Aminobacter anthyllidis]|uniref:tRNA (adenosine(37)-N6)-dimethylallyltransferase MiaA n=1 Tax=Aminobacter anthyllidis TaxID=1035067 RepID=UPI0024542765|nr:tRNA (adenosine(37)-N6)-dimethylallyltransferase MiaA [Aminobacter anthyllidis]MDH4988813.1 tRNA (adenosine(37)-N6)-dimethylallyltransferase MiaA [Aminobacter anthyllidis]
MSGIENSGTGEGRIKNATLIAGPTASGKSALALKLAARDGGVIVNADSMQVYGVLDVLTARPSADELTRVRHFLYGHVSPATAYSTGSWLRDVAVLADSGLLAEKPPIFVGGTGLYFRALAEGISEMPEIPTEIRERWRWRLNEEGAPRLHRVLMSVDSAVAMRLKASDGQRIVRALEVLEASGRSILKWQADKGHPMIDLATARFIVIEPERELLIKRIDQRFDRMIEAGALDEVKEITAMRIGAELPAMKAIGVRELAAAMAGEMSFEEAIERAKIATRQYSKRQSTWFRNQFGPEWQRIGGEAGRQPGAADA